MNYINEKDQIINSFLDLSDITRISANNVMDIVLFYLNKTKSLLINKLNYDTKLDICLNFDYYNHIKI